MADGDSHGVASSGADHGWQKVTNAKKQKRQENKAKAGEKPSTTKSSSTSDSKLFQALEEEAADRRARREARIQAALAGDAHSEEDSDAENERPVQAADETEVKKAKVKKPKKPKVTVIEAAAAIDLSDLSTFLSDISVSAANHCSRGLGLSCSDFLSASLEFFQKSES